jgi:hypothetical protein
MGELARCLRTRSDRKIYLGFSRSMTGSGNSSILQMGLSNVECVWSRAEQLQSTYDHIVARAVAPLPEFISYTRDLIKHSTCADSRCNVDAYLYIPSEKNCDMKQKCFRKSARLPM